MFTCSGVQEVSFPFLVIVVSGTGNLGQNHCDQSNLGQIQFGILCVSWWGPGGQKNVGPRRVGAPIFGTFSCVSCSHVRSFSLSLEGCLLVVFGMSRPKMCTFGFLKLQCETPAQGSYTTAQKPKHTFEGSWHPNTTNIPRNDPQRERQKERNGRDKKKRNSAQGGPGRSGATPPTRTTTTTKNNTHSNTKNRLVEVLIIFTHSPDVILCVSCSHAVPTKV